MALNREQKRSMRKRGELGEDGEAAVPRKTRSAPKAPPPKEQRTTARVFIREMRGELRKVAWPSRKETLNYSAVVGLALIFLTLLIAAFDWVFSELVLRMFNVK